MLRRYLVAFLGIWVAGCDSPAPQSPTAPGPTSPPTFLISGTVSEMVDGTAHPMPDTWVGLYVYESTRMTPRDVMTDRDGRYSAEVPAKSRVFASVWQKRQPCVANASVDKDTTLDVQVFPAGTPVVLSSPVGPTITGVVYEKTPDGRRPFRGAMAWLDISQDAYVANTETDASGRFVLCGVNYPVRMDVYSESDRFEPHSHWKLVSGNQNEFFEFEFSRP